MLFARESWRAIRRELEVEMKRRHIVIARRQIPRLGASVLGFPMGNQEANERKQCRADISIQHLASAL
jgi:hypothetical protein